MITDALPDPPALAALHLAKTGRFTDMHGQDVTLSPDLLAQLAASYDPAIYQAPLVIGHPKTNSPAFGHLAKLELTPDGLFGEPINVDPAFAEAVNSGRYPQRSLSFWPADHPQSPTPGRPYVRHLGVLGAVPPAIPGLLGADLADPAAGITTLDFSTASAAPSPQPSPTGGEGARGDPSVSTTPAEEPPMSDPDPVALAAQVADLAAQAQALSAREAALAEREAAAAHQAEGLRRAAVVAFCDTLADEARIRPTDIPALAEIVLRLEQSDPAPCFASASDPEAPAPAAPWLRAWLASLPPLVELSEQATQARALGTPGNINFSAPAGYTVDSANLAIHAKALAWLETHPDSSYQAAVTAVTGA